MLPGRCKVDGVLIPSGSNADNPTLVDVSGREVISIHGSDGIVGMYICGEAIAAKVLLEHCGAASVRSIIVCKQGDHAIESALSSFPGIEIMVLEQ
jgi:hypothetical protein